MSTPSTTILPTALIEKAQSIIDGAVRELAARGGVDAEQSLAYDLAHASSAIATARACLAYAQRGDVEQRLVDAFLALALVDLAARVLGREDLWGASPDWFAPFAEFVSAQRDPAML